MGICESMLNKATEKAKDRVEHPTVSDIKTLAKEAKKLDNWLAKRNEHPDRKAAIAGMTKLSLGGEGGARDLFFVLVQSLISDAFSSEYKYDKFSTWAEAFTELKHFEAKVKASSQNEEWMKGQRDKWLNFCNNVDSQHPAGFATAVLALEVSIKGDQQAASWMSTDRAGWVTRCNESGAKPFEWSRDNFVCSGLDGCAVILEDIVDSMKEDSMSREWIPGDYKSYGALFTALTSFETSVRASAQVPEWMQGKRTKWTQYCNDQNNHNPTGFATAVLALDISIPIQFQTLMWITQRPIWVTRCRNAGALNFDWSIS